MSRSSVAFVLFLIALVATVESKLLKDGSTVTTGDVTDAETSGNMTVAKEDTFADMIDRALAKEFTENYDQNQDNDASGFNNSVAEQQAVLETVARVMPKNETKEE